MAELWRSNERWIGHYCSEHTILLVGEGDFSFSYCLAMAFGSAANIVATSLDTYDELLKKYQRAPKNLASLGLYGGTLLHGVDATQMRFHPSLLSRKFDRIIYNFPHAGFHGKENNPDLIEMHRSLIHGFLMNASSMLWPQGEIHINHKTKAPFDSWKIDHLALECSLSCIGQEKFRIEDYPGYENKRGSGSRPDEPFKLGACCTFRFKLMRVSHHPQFPVGVPQQQQQQQQQRLSGECGWTFNRYMDHVEETFGRSESDDDVRLGVREALRNGYERYVGWSAGQKRPRSDFVSILEERQAWSILRSHRLRQMQSRRDHMR